MITECELRSHFIDNVDKKVNCQIGDEYKMQITQEFDGGNIIVLTGSSAEEICLEIRSDQSSNFFQWFYFRLSGAKDKVCQIRILNAARAAYPDGFRNYRICYSYDRECWMRHDTNLIDGVLSVDFVSEHDSVYFAYFAPYSMDRHHGLIAEAQTVDHCSHQLLGQTLDGQDLDLLRFSAKSDASEQDDRKQCWFIARQHPGETMAEWWMEGAIRKLLDVQDSLTREILKTCDLYLIPNMNPDGSRRGHLRTNAVGRNLNREWVNPTIESAPEVFLAKQAMMRTGVDFFLDIHGDESLPYCFIAGTEGLSSWTPTHQSQLDYYRGQLATLNPDFQTEFGYPVKNPGEANMSMSTTQTAMLYDCLAMTLEMPFKDTAATPDPIFGWSPLRSTRLAESCLQAMIDYLHWNAKIYA
tara:strand:+ start:9715 stop:10953 length:1239 start_codon:yes stop_codon:yes gene_type:complete